MRALLLKSYRLLPAAFLAGTVSIAAAQDAPLPPPRPTGLPAPESHGSAIDLDIPLPPQRPDDLAKPPEKALVPEAPRIASDKNAAVCKALLSSGTVLARTVAPIVGPGECGIDAPVALDAIVLTDGRHVRLQPAPTIRCDLAEGVARWISDDVVPALAAQNLVLERLINADSYSCRSRNHVAGAKLSEHARGNAIDIDAFGFQGGRNVALTSTDALPFVKAIRASACARFATILGPGSDGFHNNHIHLDLEDRRTHGTLCQWNVDPAGPVIAPSAKPTER